MSEASKPAADPGSEVHRDLADLRRGVAVNYLGYLLKTVEPVLLLVLVRLYGAETFGLFAVAQAALLFVARFCVVGLDKAMLWWVPRMAAGERRRGLRPVLFVTGVVSVLCALVIAVVAAPLLAGLFRAPAATDALRAMALALPPMVWSDVLVHAVMGRRRMESLVLVKETVLPLSLVGGGIALYATGLGVLGLAIAYPVANGFALLAAWAFHRRVFRGAPAVADQGLLPPRELLAYAVPMWFSEMANSFLTRMDVYAVAAWTNFRMVGIYAVVVQFGNTIRAIRRSFDPIVLAIVSGISTQPDRRRLTIGYSYATFLVTLTQIPVFVFLFAFASYLLPLYGTGFDAGTGAVLILCGFWVVNSAVSLAGVVVAAYGYAKVSLANVLGTIAIQAVAQAVLVPAHGIVGAALAVGIAYTAQSLAQLLEMRLFTGGWNYQSSILLPVGLGAVAASLMGVTILILGTAGLGAFSARVVGFAVFAGTYGGAVLWLWRTGRLSGRAPGVALSGASAPLGSIE